MTERILIAVAWPYANGFLHLGHIAGAELPADIFARYHRAKGNEVLMVSGSDQHGTPITIKAEEEGKTPAEIVARYHALHLEAWEKLGISYDLYTSTSTANHAAVTHDIFLTLLKNGYIYKSSMSQPYCPKCRRFLPDRYVEGTCPHCGFAGARGDQCDQCGKPLNAAELVNPRCRTCGTPPEFRDSEHFFLKLTALQCQLQEWVKKQTHWRQNVLNFTLGYLNEGLKDRAITRDIDWGITVPVPGFEGKRIYVWFEAVIGYLSASKEWATRTGDPEKWREFWQGSAQTTYFLGKDNIVFHTIIWPAMLMGYGGLNLPNDVPANEFLTIESKKGSKSRNWAVWVPDYLSRYDPDPLRYFLSINMPETSDTDFSWSEFIRRNNDELVATYGNLVNRVLTFVYRNFDGAAPAPGEMDVQSQTLLKRSEEALEKVDGLLHGCHFREAIRTAMSLAQDANRYLDDKSPWKTIKQDRAAAATSLWVVIAVISDLKTMLHPFLPFSSQKVHEYLGFRGRAAEVGWKIERPKAGQKLVAPQPLFTKLDEKLAEEEAGRLGQPTP
ncbi:MAG: methionine--tRNA ligase [Chloroflexi bacterium RBG_16_57_8]|nr:MAG: methionine--tRNA ligase [Chloroflexi bacterium RBG_16_57_8]